MKSLKKLLFVFFSTIVVSLFALAYSASAEIVEYGDITFDTSTGTITRVRYGTFNSELNIPSEINGVTVRALGDYSLDELYNVKTINIPATVERIGKGIAFRNYRLNGIYVDDNNPYYCDVDGVLYSKDMTTLVACPYEKNSAMESLPKTVTKIIGGAVYDLSVSTLDLSNVTSLGDYAIYGLICNTLIVNSNPTEYGRAPICEVVDDYLFTFINHVYFTGDSAGPWENDLKRYCTNFSYNYGGSIEGEYAVNDGYIYFDPETGIVTGAKGLWNLDIPEEVDGVKIVGIADDAFDPYYDHRLDEYDYYCFGRVTIPGSIEIIPDEAFYEVGIQEIVISDGVKIIGDRAFNYDTGSYNLPDPYLESIAIPDSVTYIGAGAFGGNERLTSLTIPGSVKTIANSAFYECNGLKTLVLEEGIETIGDSAFAFAGISELYIPQSVTTLGKRAFGDCRNLESVTYYSTTVVDKNAFVGCTSLENINIIEVEENVTSEVSVDGLNLTVHNLDGVKDYFIGKGIYNTYREVKNNSVMRVTEARINGANEYTYTVSEPGDYTVCIRFNDGSENLILYAIATAELPELETKGLALTVDGLNNIRVIRTAPGVWNSPAEVKRAEGCRNITANTIGNNDVYTVYYPESGTYTVTLEYTNGLVVVEHIELNAAEPTLVQDGNSVTFGNLDDLYVIRYVKGEYASSYEIKRAEGAKYRKPRDIVDGVITIDGLEEGTYTFCVQYNDQSCNYYTVVVE